MIPNRIKQNLKTVSPVRHDLGERDYIYVAYIHGINIQFSPDLMRLQASWGVVPESGTRRVCLIKILQGIPPCGVLRGRPALGYIFSWVRVVREPALFWENLLSPVRHQCPPFLFL